MVEAALQRIKSFDKLTFLYVLSGNWEKLRKMMKIAELRGDFMSRFHNALFLGNVEEQIAVLKETGQCRNDLRNNFSRHNTFLR